MLEKINNLKNWQVALIILIVGFAVYWTGLANPFQGDDVFQVVNNPVVHSISHIKLFFEGGTFYEGKGLKPLGGVYYRPLMTTTFSLLYSLFGLHSLYFHLFQLLLCISSAIILYLFFKFSFKPVLALFLALIFLVHPIDSQLIFSIPNMQDALFFFFGILSLYILLRFKSARSLWLVALCLFLSLLSKESGLLFVVMALAYLRWWDRKRFLSFLGIVLLPIVVWLTLRINAVGLSHHIYGVPISQLDLLGRLYTAPSIILLFFSKFVFPLKLASGYWWTYPNFSFGHVILPLQIDLMIMGVAVYIYFLLRRHAKKSILFTYKFFAAWTSMGLALYLQIIPLDFTASEPWFIFATAGMLGMIGVAVSTLEPHIKINKKYLYVLASLLLLVFAVRSSLRGLDYSSQYKLASTDLKSTSQDFWAYSAVANYDYQHKEYRAAESNATQSISIYPSYNGETVLGNSLCSQGSFEEALNAYVEGLMLEPDVYTLYEQIAELTVHGTGSNSNHQFLLSTAHAYPEDGNIWLYLAIWDTKFNYNSEAHLAVRNAAKYIKIPPSLYNAIMNNQTFYYSICNTKPIKI